MLSVMIRPSQFVRLVLRSSWLLPCRSTTQSDVSLIFAAALVFDVLVCAGADFIPQLLRS